MKQFIIGLLIGTVVSTSSVFAATTIISGKDVSYTNTNMSSTNVEDAIDEVYTTGSSIACPSGYTCTKK